MRIFDAFIYNGEESCLSIRRAELSGLDVTHILIESNYTFTGKLKPLTYFGEYENVYVRPFLNMPNTGNAWDNEKAQRNSIMDALAELNAQDEDIIIISDADEIIRREVVENYIPNDELTALKIDTYRYYLNCLEAKQNWIMPRIMKYKYLKQHTPDKVRNSGYEHMIDNGGWHFSYIGDVDFVKRKIESFSHTELNTEEFKSKLEYKMEHCQSLFGDDFWEVVNIDETFPKDVVANPEKYSHLIKQK